MPSAERDSDIDDSGTSIGSGSNNSSSYSSSRRREESVLKARPVKELITEWVTDADADAIKRMLTAMVMYVK